MWEASSAGARGRRGVGVPPPDQPHGPQLPAGLSEDQGVGLVESLHTVLGRFIRRIKDVGLTWVELARNALDDPVTSGGEHVALQGLDRDAKASRNIGGAVGIGGGGASSGHVFLANLIPRG